MAFHNQHGGAPHPNGFGNDFENGYGGGIAMSYGGLRNAYGTAYGGQAQILSPSQRLTVVQQQPQAQAVYAQSNQGYRNNYQQAQPGNRMGPNAYAPSFVPFPQHSLQPQTQVHYGGAYVVNGPGFAAAAAGPPAFDFDDDEESRNRAYADAECMTPEEFARVDEERALKKAARGKHPADAQAQPTQDRLPIDLQNALGKIITGNSIYTVAGTIEPGGDVLRMSNGIYRIKHAQGEERVAKLLRVNDPLRRERARAERGVLITLSEHQSPYINFLYDHHWANGSDNCILILQYCHGNNVEFWIKEKQKANAKFEEPFLWHAIHHLCSALALCHHGIRNPLKKDLQPKTWNAICHLDIKPANIFFDMKRGRGMEDDEYPTIVLGDFGCAVTSDDMKKGKFSNTKQPFGTEAWYPPEGREGFIGEHAGCYGKSTDIWQLGAVIACMARLDVLPDREALATTKPCGPAYSDALNKTVHLMLNGKIGKRPTVIDIAEKMKALGHLKEEMP